MILSSIVSLWNHIADSSLAPVLILSLISIGVIVLSDRKTRNRAAGKEPSIQAQ